MFVLGKCCFCIELRTGSFIVAYMQLSLEIVTFILVLNGVMDGSPMLASRLNSVEEMGIIMMSCSLTFLAFIALLFLLTILLIVGLHKRNRRQILAYLICATGYLIAYTTTAFMSFPMLSVSQLDVAFKTSSLVLQAYFIFVIRCYWKRIGLKNRAVYTT